MFTSILHLIIVITGTTNQILNIFPQMGPQYNFCASQARVCIYGGAAGGGKSYGLLMDAVGAVGDPTYNAMIFRRKYTEIILPGALWDTSVSLYGRAGGVPSRGRTEWQWSGGGKIKFTHLNQEDNVHDHQGGQYCYIGFDELPEFTLYQFCYLITRNRPPDGCNIAPRVRGTCNPDADSWVAEFLSWWWDASTGYAIPERSGVLKWFIIEDNKPVWVADNYRDKDGNAPMSCTFIAASLDDNPILTKRDPTYKANLAGKDRVTRERLLHGNWLITYGGNMFDPLWFGIVEDYPRGGRIVRYWDFAASEVDDKTKNDPDWTAGALCTIVDGVLYICDMQAFRETPGTAEKLVRSAAEYDGPAVEQWWEEEKGSSGKYASEYMRKVFHGYEAHADPVSGSKVERAKPWSSWAEFKRVKLVRGDWNRRFLGRAGKFPDGKRDEIDAVSGAFKVLVGAKKVLTQYRPEQGHLQRFPRALEDFQKIQAPNVEVYITLWADSKGGIYGGCYVWSLVANRLRLYNEIYMEHPTAPDLYREIEEKLVCPMESDTWAHLTKAIANDAFFKVQNENMAKEVKRAGLRVRPIINYDENAAILRLNRLFAGNSVVVHTDCVESDVQLRGWMYDKTKAADGFPLARAACLLVCELRSGGRLADRQPAAQYSAEKQSIREKLKRGGIHADVKTAVTDNDKQWEYLV